MSDLKQKMLEFLEEGIKYYSVDVDRRCVSATRLCYYSPKGAGKEGISEGCFIGRHMTVQQQNKADAVPVHLLPLHLIPDKLKEFPIEFLRDCQKLHDTLENWGSLGLSRSGKKEVNRIREQWQI